MDNRNVVDSVNKKLSKGGLGKGRCSLPTRDDDDEAGVSQSVKDCEVSSNDGLDEVVHGDGEAVRRSKKKKLSLASLQDFDASLRKRGVVYLSRIPPRMGPSKVKSLLSELDRDTQVTRVYLEPEDDRNNRRRSGGGGKRYTQGWVEFSDKHVAKHIAMSLNSTPISNQKRNAHYGDLWNMKYLPTFHWAHLTEKVAYERRVREQKIRVEMMQAKREQASYTNLVEKGHTMDYIEKRRRKRDRQLDERPAKTFPQTAPFHDDRDRDRDDNPPSAKRAVLTSLV